MEREEKGRESVVRGVGKGDFRDYVRVICLGRMFLGVLER